MNPSHLMAILLAVALLAGQLAVVVVEAARPQSTVGFLMFGIGFGQTALVAAWLALGQAAIGWRLVCAVAATAAIAGINSRLTPTPFLAWWGLFGLFVAGLSGPLMVFRIRGLRIDSWGLAESESPVSPRERRGQYSIGGLMLATTVVALAAAGGRNIPARLMMEGFLLCVCFCGNAWAALWGAWGGRAWPLRLAVAVVVWAGASLVAMFSMAIMPGSTFLLFGAQALTILLGSKVLKNGGFEKRWIEDNLVCRNSSQGEV